jgi:hypothetical protein
MLYWLWRFRGKKPVRGIHTAAPSHSANQQTIDHAVKVM